MFNRYNTIVESSRNAVSRHIMYLLKPDDGYVKESDNRLKELYDVWRADCRAMDAALEECMHLAARADMIKMPPDDAEHSLCRRFAAIIIERNIFGEHNVEQYLAPLVEKLKSSDCWKHPDSCACHVLYGWTYANNDIVHSLVTYYIQKERDNKPVHSGGGPLSHTSEVGYGGPPPSYTPTPDVHNIDKCACSKCHKTRVANGTQDAYMAKLRAETDKVLGSLVTKPSSGKLDGDFVKNLFKSVQGVNYDDKCPHALPYYACMSCSH
jgi:hypothetical protein